MSPVAITLSLLLFSIVMFVWENPSGRYGYDRLYYFSRNRRFDVKRFCGFY